MTTPDGFGMALLVGPSTAGSPCQFICFGTGHMAGGLRNGKVGESLSLLTLVDDEEVFPMVTVPAKTFIEMTSVQPYEELIEAESLRIFEESMGKAMFVSHQWVASEHPDPDLQQFPVLQQALKNLIAGQSKVQLPAGVELVLGRYYKCPTAADFNPEELYIWYDYCCCPQGNSPRAVLRRQQAIRMIPAFVSKSALFVILCPYIRTNDRTLSYSTWKARGWCRLEYLSRHIARDDGCVITIKSESHATLAWNFIGVVDSPGTGDFTIEEDRAQVGQVVLKMIWRKLHSYLKNGDRINYCFLSNVQHIYLKGFDLDPIESLIPGFDTDVDPCTDPDGFIVARFLHDNWFHGLADRDAAGWSPLCYAVLTGQVSLVSALLNCRADANEGLRKSKKQHHLTVKPPISVLSLATLFCNNQFLGLLLTARANINARDGSGGTALNSSALVDNAPAVRTLVEAKVDPLIKSFPNLHPFETACASSSVGVMKEMLALDLPGITLRYSLHGALFGNASSDCISFLIQASADVNEQVRYPRTSPLRIFLGGLSLLHHFSPSSMTHVAYHHSGATPLMHGIWAGCFEGIPILLAAGARLDIPNDRGKTAADFLQLMNVPDLGPVDSDDESFSI